MPIGIFTDALFAGAGAGAGAFRGVSAVGRYLSLTCQGQAGSLSAKSAKRGTSSLSRIRSELCRIRFARLSRYSATLRRVRSKRDLNDVCILSANSRSGHACLTASASMADSSRSNWRSIAKTSLLPLLLANQASASAVAFISLSGRSRRCGDSKSRSSRLYNAARKGC